jgi:UDP-N-acetylglucosamine 4,6-dehydratase
MFNNKNILITGGTGTFGKKFISILLKKFNPKKIIIYSRDELKQFEHSQNNLKDKKKLRYFIGDVRDKDRLEYAINEIDIIVHAAALKQVPAAEYNPFEAVKTNIIGANNIIECAIKKNVEKTIALSSDKASSPVNLYGATKLVSDKIFIAANNYKGKSNCKFSVVRYGNVFGSRGSVVSLLKNHNLKSINLTDKRMTRFFITIEDGVEFVISALSEMKGGEIFIPKLKSIKIEDLIKSIRPEIKIKVSGVRPGEKMHEELISSSESINTFEYKNKYIIFNPMLINSKLLKKLKKVKEGFSYSSDKNGKYLSRSEILSIFKNQKNEIA